MDSLPLLLVLNLDGQAESQQIPNVFMITIS